MAIFNYILWVVLRFCKGGTWTIFKVLTHLFLKWGMLTLKPSITNFCQFLKSFATSSILLDLMRVLQAVGLMAFCSKEKCKTNLIVFSKVVLNSGSKALHYLCNLKMSIQYKDIAEMELFSNFNFSLLYIENLDHHPRIYAYMYIWRKTTVSTLLWLLYLHWSAFEVGTTAACKSEQANKLSQENNLLFSLRSSCSIKYLKLQHFSNSS